MDFNQLQDRVVIPMLEKIPKGKTQESINAVMMIIAHESVNGFYLVQLKGPALGMIQMEPLTHNETWKWGDTIWINALTCEIITQQEFDSKSHPKPDRLIYDLAYNVFMCRQRLFMKKGALPTGMHELSNYLKNAWNSAYGKAEDYSYVHSYNNWNK